MKLGLERLQLIGVMVGLLGEERLVLFHLFEQDAVGLTELLELVLHLGLQEGERNGLGEFEGRGGDSSTHPVRHHVIRLQAKEPFEMVNSGGVIAVFFLARDVSPVQFLRAQQAEFEMSDRGTRVRLQRLLVGLDRTPIIHVLLAPLALQIMAVFRFVPRIILKEGTSGQCQDTSQGDEAADTRRSDSHGPRLGERGRERNVSRRDCRSSPMGADGNRASGEGADAPLAANSRNIRLPTGGAIVFCADLKMNSNACVEGNVAAAVDEAPLIYLVDDEPLLLELAEMVLDGNGYRFEKFQDSVDALNAFRTASRRPDLLITDYAMFDLNGIELIERCRALQADLRVILISGTVDENILDGTPELADHFLRKPYRTVELGEAVKNLLKR